jgi:hypothetical protein
MAMALRNSRVFMRRRSRRPQWAGGRFAMISQRAVDAGLTKTAYNLYVALSSNVARGLKKLEAAGLLRRERQWTEYGGFGASRPG